MTEYGVLVADPPWLTGKGHFKQPGGAACSAIYPCMPTEDICNFPLPPMAKDSVLFLWRLSSFVIPAYEVCVSWGFEPKAELVWRKTHKSGIPCFGTGMTVHGAHEVCIIAKRGSPKRLGHVRSVFDAECDDLLFDAVRGKHSEKPDAFYELVEKMYPGPYAELFARRIRAGWHCEGNEL